MPLITFANQYVQEAGVKVAKLILVVVVAPSCETEALLCSLEKKGKHLAAPFVEDGGDYNILRPIRS